MEMDDVKNTPELDLLTHNVAAPAKTFDRVEAVLFDRIAKFERTLSIDATRVPWDAVVASDEFVPSEPVGNAEQKLFDRISQAEGGEPWELYLKKEVSAADLSSLEKRLSHSIPAATAPYFFPLLFSTISLAISKHKKPIIALAVLALGLSAFIFRNTFIGNDSPLATKLTSVGGTKGPSQIIHEHQTVWSAAGQMLVLSNARGTVMLQNSAGITLLKARRRIVEYAVDFRAGSHTPGGRVIFSVAKKLEGQEFSVATKDYVIHVVGTVFRITPQSQGRTALQVLDGAVRIEGEGIAALVSAGSIFAFDDNTGTYSIGAGQTGHLSNSRNHPLPEPASAASKPAPQFHHVNKGILPPRDSLLELAVRLEGPDWKKAVETYRAALGRRASSAYGREIALFSIGRLLSDNSAPASEVKAAFNAYLKDFPGGNFAGESYLRLADLEYKTDPGRSLAWYEKYLREFPATQNTAAAEYKAGLIYLEQKKHEKAAAMLSSALRHAENYPADQVSAIQRALDIASNPRGDSIRNASVKFH